jgi:hypothetical protein
MHQAETGEAESVGLFCETKSEDPEAHSSDQPGIAPEKDGQRFPAALADLNDQGFVEGFGVYGYGGSRRHRCLAALRGHSEPRQTKCESRIHETSARNSWSSRFIQ